MIPGFGESSKLLDCLLVRRDGSPPEEIRVDLDGHDPGLGDTLTMQSGGRQFYVAVKEHHIRCLPGTSVVPGIREFVILHELRHCPECRIPYGNVHPDSHCKHGTVEAVMES